MKGCPNLPSAGAPLGGSVVLEPAMAAAGARVAAENPLREGDAPAAETDGPLFPRIEHPYPCAGCAAFHDDESGFCPHPQVRVIWH